MIKYKEISRRIMFEKCYDGSVVNIKGLERRITEFWILYQGLKEKRQKSIGVIASHSRTAPYRF